MPKHKDLKRVVRARMRKTGESYTAARSCILTRPGRRELAPHEPGARPEPPDYAALGGMSDDAVRAKTARTWQQWVAALDDVGAAGWPHREIAAHLHQAHGLPGWWAQTVTVGYERIRELRDVGQRRGGGYEVNKSKTVGVPLPLLFAAFADPERRSRWLPGVELRVRTATTDKSLRMSWPDDTALDATFTAKGPAKSQVSLQHRKLASKAAADRLRSFWSERLDELEQQLRSGGR